jgi:hypothetical protein
MMGTRSLAKMPQRVALALALLAVSLACSSCSGAKGQPVFPVHGKVLFRGKPAAGALVVLHSMGPSTPQQERPRAVVEDDGSFSVSTFAAKDGAPAGDYAVSINWKSKTVKTPGRKGPAKKVPTNFPKRYENPKTSGLVVRVQEGPNELRPFDIKD